MGFYLSLNYPLHSLDVHILCQLTSEYGCLNKVKMFASALGLHPERGSNSSIEYLHFSLPFFKKQFPLKLERRCLNKVNPLHPDSLLSKRLFRICLELDESFHSICFKTPLKLKGGTPERLRLWPYHLILLLVQKSGEKTTWHVWILVNHGIFTISTG